MNSAVKGLQWLADREGMTVERVLACIALALVHTSRTDAEAVDRVERMFRVAHETEATK